MNVPSPCVSPSMCVSTLRVCPFLVSVYVFLPLMSSLLYVPFLLSVYVPFPCMSCHVYISSPCVFPLPSPFISSLHICILFVCVFSVYVPSQCKSSLMWLFCEYPFRDCPRLYISPLCVCPLCIYVSSLYL